MAAAHKPKRVLLKLSGEALADRSGQGIEESAVTKIGQEIADVAKAGAQIAVAIGGGNIWRGKEHPSIERATSDTMGMLAHVINALALQNAIERAGVECRVQTALGMPEVAEPYIRRRAIRHLEKGRVVILAAGIGRPYYTTDTGAATRALEIGATVLLKGSKVDGIYSADPKKDATAQKFETISYTDVLTQDLKVMDATAIALCRENNLPIVVFNVLDPKQLEAAVLGQDVGTKVTG